MNPNWLGIIFVVVVTVVISNFVFSGDRIKWEDIETESMISVGAKDNVLPRVKLAKMAMASLKNNPNEDNEKLCSTAVSDLNNSIGVVLFACESGEPVKQDGSDGGSSNEQGKKLLTMVSSAQAATLPKAFKVKSLKSTTAKIVIDRGSGYLTYSHASKEIKIPFNSGQFGFQSTNWYTGRSPVPFSSEVKGGKYYLHLKPVHNSPGSYFSEGKGIGTFYPLSNSKKDAYWITSKDGKSKRGFIGIHPEDINTGTEGCVGLVRYTQKNVDDITEMFDDFDIMRQNGFRTIEVSIIGKEKLYYQDQDFRDHLALVLKHEGGVSNNGNDPGGYTKFGLSKRSHPNIDFNNLTKNQVAEIYFRDYYVPSGAPFYRDEKLAVVAFDTLVNHGIGKGRELIRQSRGDSKKLINLRKDAYRRDKNCNTFCNGWLNRLASLEGFDVS